MTRFSFVLRTGEQIIEDRPGGEQIFDITMAREHARQVARELMRNNERQARFWQIEVHDEHGAVALALPFTALDPTLRHLPRDTQRLIVELCRRGRALAEAVTSARHSIQQARSTLARAQGKPYVVAEFGRDLRP